jgi:hypothetical protein
MADAVATMTTTTAIAVRMVTTDSNAVTRTLPYILHRDTRQTMATVTMPLRLRECDATVYAPTVAVLAPTTIAIDGRACVLPAGSEVTLVHRRPLRGAVVVAVVDGVGYRVLNSERTCVTVEVDPTAVAVSWDHAEPHRAYLPTLDAPHVVPLAAAAYNGATHTLPTCRGHGPG